MKLKRILTLTAPLILLGVRYALASTTLPIANSITTFCDFISTDVAYGLVGIGFAGVAGHCVTGRDFGMSLHHAVGTIVGGGMASQLNAVAGAFNLSAAALIHITH